MKRKREKQTKTDPKIGRNNVFVAFFRNLVKNESHLAKGGFFYAYGLLVREISF